MKCLQQNLLQNQDKMNAWWTGIQDQSKTLVLPEMLDICLTFFSSNLLLLIVKLTYNGSKTFLEYDHILYMGRFSQHVFRVTFEEKNCRTDVVKAD